MPHIPVHPSAIKRHRQNLKRRVRNRLIKANLHSAVKSANEAIAEGDQIGATTAFRNAQKVLAKAASKGTLHRNTAARKVGRLARRLHKAQAKA